MKDVGLTVREGEHPPVVFCPSGGVEVEGVGRDFFCRLAGVSGDAGDVVCAQKLEILCGRLAVFRVALDIKDLLDGLRKIVAVHAQSSGQVAERVPQGEPLFVAGGRFRRTLFCGEPGGVDEFLARVPFGEFVFDRLAGDDLFGGEPDVDSRIFSRGEK